MPAFCIADRLVPCIFIANLHDNLTDKAAISTFQPAHQEPTAGCDHDQGNHPQDDGQPRKRFVIGSSWRCRLCLTSACASRIDDNRCTFTVKAVFLCTYHQFIVVIVRHLKCASKTRELVFCNGCCSVLPVSLSFTINVAFMSAYRSLSCSG